MCVYSIVAPPQPCCTRRRFRYIYPRKKKGKKKKKKCRLVGLEPAALPLPKRIMCSAAALWAKLRYNSPAHNARAWRSVLARIMRRRIMRLAHAPCAGAMAHCACTQHIMRSRIMRVRVMLRAPHIMPSRIMGK